jgi:SnoaL-like protein
MSEEAVRALFDTWERVWHEGQYHLVSQCVAPAYIRHDESGTRTVTPAAYAAELEAGHKARPNTRITVYDHAFTANRAWFRFNLTWTDAATGEKRSRAGMQSYRIEFGKLAETWLSLLPAGSAWPDVGRQERWTVKYSN